MPVATQAAHLCKADLATSMVTEMTALAGTMGRHYALTEGLPPGGWVVLWELGLDLSTDLSLDTSASALNVRSVLRAVGFCLLEAS